MPCLQYRTHNLFFIEHQFEIEIKRLNLIGPFSIQPTQKQFSVDIDGQHIIGIRRVEQTQNLSLSVKMKRLLRY